MVPKLLFVFTLFLLFKFCYESNFFVKLDFNIIWSQCWKKKQFLGWMVCINVVPPSRATMLKGSGSNLAFRKHHISNLLSFLFFVPTFREDCFNFLCVIHLAGGWWCSLRYQERRINNYLPLSHQYPLPLHYYHC